MNKRKFRTLILMPWLPLQDFIKFDNLTLWPFKKYKDTYIKDQATREHVEKLIACYQLHKGGLIRNPTVITIGKTHFSNPSRLNIAKIETLKSILLFAGVLNINSWSFVTSDNFEVIYQRFNVGEDGIATQAGAIHGITTGGYQIGDIVFVKPDYVNLHDDIKISTSVVKALEDCLINSPGNPAKSQVIQSLNPFFTAYRNSHEHSWAARILLMLMSFELLFGESERENFRKNIQKYSLLDSNLTLPTYKYQIIHTETGKIIREEQLTLNQIWAEEFYKLRNRIIHGNTVYSDDFVFRDQLKLVKRKNLHFYIAVNFFVVCVLNKLRELGFKSTHLIINPTADKNRFGKVISGDANETFKIEDRDLYDMLSSSLSNP